MEKVDMRCTRHTTCLEMLAFVVGIWCTKFLGMYTFIGIYTQRA